VKMLTRRLFRHHWSSAGAPTTLNERLIGLHPMAPHTSVKDAPPPAHGDPLTLSDEESGFAMSAVVSGLGAVRKAAVDAPIAVLGGQETRP
jgi:hypothetical protein